MLCVAQLMAIEERVSCMIGAGGASGGTASGEDGYLNDGVRVEVDNRGFPLADFDVTLNTVTVGGDNFSGSFDSDRDVRSRQLKIKVDTTARHWKFVCGRGVEFRVSYSRLSLRPSTTWKVDAIKRGKESGQAESVTIHVNDDEYRVFVTQCFYSSALLDCSGVIIIQPTAINTTIAHQRYIGPAARCVCVLRAAALYDDDNV